MQSQLNTVKYILCMKQSVSLLLVALMLFLPMASLSAAESNKNVPLQAQLNALQTHLYRLTAPNQVFIPLTEDEMRLVIVDGTNWLLKTQEENGHFAYEYVPYDGTYLKDDNIVRQGGALFALGEVYRRQVNKDASIEKGIVSAIEFFENMSIEGKEKGTSFRCVANSERSSTCKLGATALVLTGILGYVEGKPAVEKKYKKLINDYTTYILTSQKSQGESKGGFRHEYRTTKGFGDEESPFSNGEALLALVRAYQVKSNTDVKKSIDNSFNYLKHKEYDNSLYLWIMAALKDMQYLWPNDEYITYTRDFTVWRMASKPYLNDRNVCAYAEGVASAYSVLASKPLGAELSYLHKELDTLNAYHKRLQLSDNDMYRVITKPEGGLSVGTLIEPTRAEGGFITAHSNLTQRIDFTQHCISTYVQTLVDIDGKSL